MHLSGLERWISLVRLAAVPFALVAVAAAGYPDGREAWAWATTGVFAAGAAGFFALARSGPGSRHPVVQSLAAQAFDTLIVTGYVLVFSFERGTPVQQTLYIVLAAACVRFEIPGGLVLAAVSAPIVAGWAKLHADHLGVAFSWSFVGLQTGFEVLMALVVGWLVRRLAAGGVQAEARAAEAELLRDELSRRADLADAAYESERRTVEELRRLSTLRADFVSLVSHEVRSPMAAVIGAARTLQERGPDLSDDQRDAFVGLIADETARLAALVGEVLDSSRIDDGTFTYSFAELDLGSLVSDAVASVELGRSAVDIAATVPPGLPPVRGDAARLRQVLTNLIDNAVKYSPAGAPVEVRASAADGHVAVSVVDRGAGIAPVDQQRIFEKFGRVRGTSSTPGSGLGLYIARAIAEAHHGTLEVTSTPGEGSTFTLTLPAGGT